MPVYNCNLSRSARGHRYCGYSRRANRWNRFAVLILDASNLVFLYIQRNSHYLRFYLCHVCLPYSRTFRPDRFPHYQGEMFVYETALTRTQEFLRRPRPCVTARWMRPEKTIPLSHGGGTIVKNGLFCQVQFRGPTGSIRFLMFRGRRRLDATILRGSPSHKQRNSFELQV